MYGVRVPASAVPYVPCTVAPQAVPAQKAPEEMLELLATLRAGGYLVGIVGAGDFEKQQGQLGGPDLRERG